MNRVIVLVFIAVVAVPTWGQAQTEEVLYVHTDAVGSVRMLTDANGQVVERYDYLPFGEPWSASPTGDETRRFTGQERDPETGFDYLGARFYASGNGRFTRPDDPGYADALNPQTWNLYAYVGNNPLRFVDPSGHSGDCVHEYDSSTGRCAEGTDYGTWRFYWDSWNNLHLWITSAMNRLEVRHPEINQHPVLGTSPFIPPVGRFAGLIGRSFGTTGRTVGNPGISIRGFQGSVVPGHAINQVINRGVSPQLLRSIVGNPTVVLEQAGGRYLYLTGQGAVVMTREGQVVTAWTARDFLPQMWQVLRTVAGQ